MNIIEAIECSEPVRVVEAIHWGRLQEIEGALYFITKEDSRAGTMEDLRSNWEQYDELKQTRRTDVLAALRFAFQHTPGVTRHHFNLVLRRLGYKELS